jgi:hypothetical protein
MMKSQISSIVCGMAPIVLWTARLLSMAILAFWGWFAVASLTGDAGRGSRLLVLNDYVLMAALAAALAGLAAAWRWNLAGGTVALVAILIAARFNWRVLVFPGTLILVAAALWVLLALLECSPVRQDR